MTTEEKLDRLTAIVEALAATVAAHDAQIEKLIAAGLQQKERIDELVADWVGLT